MQTEHQVHGVQVDYEKERILLQGEEQAVRHEAERILRQYQFTGHPYRLTSGHGGRLVLTRAD